MTLAAVHHPDYSFDLPANHPFPMAKFRVLRRQLAAFDHRIRWHQPGMANRSALESVHTGAYLDALLAGELDHAAQRRSGFPWSQALIRRIRLETGGTLLAARLALAEGIALNAAGGTHHAHADYASGYCLLNDLAVTAKILLSERRVRRVLIIDLDVHQGDGTVRLLADEPDAVTLSIHAARNFPARKAAGDEDIELESGLTDAAYLEVLSSRLPPVIDRVQPDLVIYDAGVDVHTADRLGHLDLTDDGLYRRDRYVIDTVRARGIPLAGVIGGGYDRDLEALCRRHGQLFVAALDAVGK
ncbi:histone deacetylase [Spiribacter vilamensis]|uniref:Acetoin utilization deacetylase AcuC-like enzyme n=1 Tax=Spiribacter vilamensis TaxID=531306 RepID=A0A4Q8D026_9GAMM|nr:histone deacetylase [Spiribacter vilamensis]RZU98661.1 acetoin utilization deacetylase AcuC-like enzyme [Spiribacter vilamensis]TVO60082.1 histone deacetylase [Spiribacter vilamensis]